MTTDVGGGFGARGEFYPEHFLYPYLSQRLGTPVSWVLDATVSLMLGWWLLHTLTSSFGNHKVG